METYSIQLALPEHLEQLQQIEYISASRFSSETLPLPIRNRVISLEEHTRAQAAGQLWVALAENEQPIGFALVHVVNMMAYLAEIDVHPNYGCRGIGNALITTIIQWAKNKHLHCIGLTTFTHIPWNAPFYKKLGFESVDVHRCPEYLVQVLIKESEDGLQNRTAMILKLCEAPEQLKQSRLDNTS
ncbi:MAG: GNAT family N-acetyltransferase [Pseudomonadota bacterium]